MAFYIFLIQKKQNFIIDNIGKQSKAELAR